MSYTSQMASSLYICNPRDDGTGVRIRVKGEDLGQRQVKSHVEARECQEVLLPPRAFTVRAKGSISGSVQTSYLPTKPLTSRLRNHDKEASRIKDPTLHLSLTPALQPQKNPLSRSFPRPNLGASNPQPLYSPLHTAPSTGKQQSELPTLVNQPGKFHPSFIEVAVDVIEPSNFPLQKGCP